ncbi:MAG: hypothetical protein JOZ19_06500 [Rubrobacter sp.]|nr:hypothetical protein [Rubrobacter sp.]
MTNQQDRASRLAARFEDPPAKAVQSEPKAPYVRRTYYIRRDIADRLDEEQRRLNYELGGLAKSHLLQMLLLAGFDHLPEIVTTLKKERNVITHDAS